VKPRVLVVGGGPAGVGVALALAGEGVAALVVDRATHFHDKPGECLTPNFRPLLERLRLSVILESHSRIPQFRSRWEGNLALEQAAVMSPYGEGWLLNRRKFEAQLALAATERGVSWHIGWSLSSLERHGNVWLAELRRTGENRTVEADYVVDATGRSAKVLRLLGEPRTKIDRLFASWLTFGSNGQRDRPVSIAADVDGWWYCATLPGGQTSMVWFSDKAINDDRTLCERARRCSFLGVGVEHEANSSAKLSVHSVGSIRANRVCGPGWFAVGDAAQTFDPLSSYGIGSALGTGFYAARALLSDWSGNNAALNDYQSLLEQGWCAYLDFLAERYSVEHAWSEQPFWVERRNRLQRAWGAAPSRDLRFP
jgi:flavin-dependent dehydrogenase